MHQIPVLAFHLDDTLAQFSADGILILAIFVNVLLGWRCGLVRRVVGFGGSYLGALAATHVGNPLASLVGGHDINTNAWFFVAIFLGVTVMIELLGYLYNERIQKMIVITFDRILGCAAGAVLGFFQIGILYLVATSTAALPGAAPPGSGISGYAVTHATLSQLVVKSEPFIKNVFAPVLPGDMGAHIADTGNKSNTLANG
jgi:Colicin V production protein